MRRLTVLVGIVLASSLVAVVVATPAPALGSRDRQMKDAILLLRGYVDRAGAQHFFVYPNASEVSRAGTLPAPLWPRDPWTGEPLTAGTGKGHYAYRVSADGRSFRLTGYLSSGTFVTSGQMPVNFKVAYDHRSKEGLALIQQYVELWARRHGDAYPVADEVDRHAAVGMQPGMRFWPSNPWNHDPMAQGVGPGFFQYRRAAGGSGYDLTLHLVRSGDWTLTSEPFQPDRQLSLALRDETMRRNVHLLRCYVDEWALLHAGVLPDESQLAPDGDVGAIHDSWPLEPYTGSPMAPGDGLGRYTYTVNGDGSYTIAAPLAATGAGTVVVTARPPLPPE